MMVLLYIRRSMPWILEETRLVSSKSVDTPMDPNTKLLPN